MIKKIFGSLVLGIVISASANAAHYVELRGPTAVDPGETFQVEIWGDFLANGLRAGGLQVSFDPTVASGDVSSFSTDLGVDSSFSCPGSVNCPADAAGTITIVWGEFSSDLIDADAGPTLMGTLQITAADANGTEGTGIALALSDFLQLTGGWFGAGFAQMDSPELRGLVVDVNTAVIPLPAAVWFMIGGLATLLRFRRS